MLVNFKKGYENLKGTGSELRDNHDYDKLVDLVGEAGAQRAIQHKLQDRSLTFEEWQTYRKVRSVLHRNPLRVREEIKMVSDLADGVVDI
jgi:hypothetical protein